MTIYLLPDPFAQERELQGFRWVSGLTVRGAVSRRLVMAIAVEQPGETGGSLSYSSWQLGSIHRKIDLHQMPVYTDCYV